MAATASEKLQSTHQSGTRKTNATSAIDRIKSNLPIQSKTTSGGKDDAMNRKLSSSAPSLAILSSLSQRRNHEQKQLEHQNYIECEIDDNNNNKASLNRIKAIASTSSTTDDNIGNECNTEMESEKMQPMKPRRQKLSRTTCADILGIDETERQEHCGSVEIPIERIELVDEEKMIVYDVSSA